MKGYVSTANRLKKAQKINKILEEYFNKPIKGLTLLDIGTGNGEIANFFATKGNTVYSVDVQKLVKDENILFNFVYVQDEQLPFEDNYFDIVLSNHVIEHIGNANEHLSEIHRVMKRGGVCYFATPNRNFPKEVHTKTILLHYFPYRIFWILLRFIHKYQEPIKLLTYGRMKKLFKKSGFKYEDYTMKIINNPAKYYIKSKWKWKLPMFMAAAAPTNIFVLINKDG